MSGGLPGDWEESGAWAWSAEATRGGAAGHPFGVAEGDRYEEESEGLTGGMGTVVVARDRRLGREVVIKRPRRDLDGTEATRRLVQEARIAAQLDHPGVCAVLDAGLDPDGTPWVAMRRVRGRTLAAAMSDAGTWNERQRLAHVVLGTAEAVGAAHQVGIVHRDLKPANILVGPDGEAQVIDWGLARPVDGSRAAWDRSLLPVDHCATTRTGAVMGTPAFMSPEQVVGGTLTAASDVWSLGAMLFEVLTGARPFPSDTPVETLRARLVEDAPDARSLDADLPPALADLCRASLSIRPEDRPADGQAFADALRVALSPPAQATPLRQRPWGAGMGGLMVGAGAAVLMVGTPAPVAAPSTAHDVVLSSLVTQGRLAAREGRWALTERVARALEARGEVAHAAGMRWARGGNPQPVEVVSLPLPACPAPLLAPAGGVVVCHDRAGLVAWRLPTASDAEPALAWRRELQGIHQVSLAGDGAELAVVAPPALWSMRLADGAVLHELREAEPVRLAQHPGARVLINRGDRVQTLHHDGTLVPAVAPVLPEWPTTWLGLQSGAWSFMPSGLAARTRDDGTVSVVEGLPSFHKLAFSRPGVDGQVLLVGYDGEIRALDLDAGQVLWTVDLGEPVEDVAASAEGLLVARARGGVDVRSSRGALRARLPVEARTVAWGADGTILTVGAEVGVWQVSALARPLRWELGSGIASVDVSDDGTQVAAAQGSGDVRVFDLGTGGEVIALSHGEMKRVVKDVWIGPGTLWAVGPDADIPLARYAMPSGTLEAVMPDSWGYRRVEGLPGGRMLALPYRAGPHVYEADGTLRRDLILAQTSFPDVGLTADGRLGILSGEDGRMVTITVGDDVVLTPRAPLEGVVAVDIRDDGWLVASVGRTVVLRGADDIERLTFATELGDVTDLAWSPDGTVIAVGTTAGTVELRDAQGRLIALLDDHVERIGALDWLPDGGLVSGGWDGVVRRWAPPRAPASP